MNYDFYSRYARILNSKQSRSVILFGDVYDLFWDGNEYCPLLNFLLHRTKNPKNIQVVYELNGPVKIEDNEEVRKAYITYKSGVDVNELLIKAAADSSRSNLSRVGTSEKATRAPETEYDILSKEFDSLKRESHGNMTVGLQFLRQLCDASRKCLSRSLQIIIESGDMILPNGKDLASLSDRDRQRVAIVQDWFSDPAFCNGGDSVTLVAESRSMIHSRVSQLPQVLSVEIPAPNAEARQHFISTFAGERKIYKGAEVEWSMEEFSRLTAGLSNHAIRQLLSGSFYSKEPITSDILVSKIEEYIQSQVGDDVVEFKKPEHNLDSVIGFTKLKEFLRSELIPRFRSSGADSLSGAAVGGPIGAGKTFIFEAVASELGVPVLVLKNLRSQWYGQTDVIFERLRRVLEALEKVIIFVDEADTQFGGVGADEQSTERRLTGKIQAMMSDSKLRGRVTWLLMTARIHLLSPDIRRPGRVGDLIIPILDPEGDDRIEFCRWVAKGCLQESNFELVEFLRELTQGWSAAAYASLRSHLQAYKDLTINRIKEIVKDQIPPNIGPTRLYQKLQALDNCTRISLIPAEELATYNGEINRLKEAWQEKIADLERHGIK